MSEPTVPLEDDLPRWILDQPTEADLAPGGGLEDCDGVDLDGTFDMVDADGGDLAKLDVPVDGMVGVDLPDADEAEAEYGDPPIVGEWDQADDEDAADAEEDDVEDEDG